MYKGYVIKSHVYCLSVPPSVENKLYTFVIGVPVPEGSDIERLRDTKLTNTADLTDTSPPHSVF